jgi:hypothetical protein
MPITLSKIASNSASVSFQYGEDQVNLVYYPGRITERTYALLRDFTQISDANGVVDGLGRLNELLAGKPFEIGQALIDGKMPAESLPILKSWDVLQDDGVTMYPIQSESLSLLPIEFRTAVIQAILGDIRPNRDAPQK